MLCYTLDNIHTALKPVKPDPEVKPLIRNVENDDLCCWKVLLAMYVLKTPPQPPRLVLMMSASLKENKTGPNLRIKHKTVFQGKKNPAEED